MIVPRILIVEDESVLAMDLELRLQRLGYEVAGTASCGEEAVQMAADLAPSLILMDVMLGAGIDGTEAARRILTQTDLPVVYLTAYSDRATLERARETAPYGYVLKPFSDNDLRVAIEIAAHKHQTDVQMRALQRRVARTEAMAQLAGGLSHDINNALTGLLGYANVLRDELSPADPRRQHLDEILEAATRIGALSSQLSAFSTRRSPRLDTISLGETIQGEQPALKRLLPDNVQLSVEVDEAVPPVAIDPVHLHQIVRNLVMSARDGLQGRGGAIHLRVGTTAGEAELHVRDTGVIPPPQDMARMLEPFAGGAGSRGGGLGLAAVNALVQKAGGHVQVSAAEGGMEVVATFPPAVVAEQPPVEPATRETPGRSRARPVILVVDDESMVRTLSRHLLEQGGFDVLEAEDASQALQVLHAGSGVDVMLTDVVMPGLNGFELRQRALAEFPCLPVVMMSGFAEDALEKMGAGAADIRILPKPFTAQQLRRAVDEALSGAVRSVHAGLQ